VKSGKPVPAPLDSQHYRANTALVNAGVRAVSIGLATAAVFAVGAAAGLAVRSPQSADPPVRLSPEELETYRRARNLVDWTPQEIKQSSSLYKLRVAENDDTLPVILKRVGERAAAMIAEFRNIACDERVYTEWNVGSPIATWREMGPNEVAHHFLYIIIPRPAGDPRMFTEYRTDPKGNPIDLARLTDLRLITTNFTGSWSYFNTSNQVESRFRYFGEESLRKHLCYVVGFAQTPDVSRNISTFEVGNHTAVILVQGLAWIDEESSDIVRIETWLLAPRKDIGLESQNTVVDYFPTLPGGVANVLWLPKEVTVLVQYKNVFVRNTHRYSGFKLFQTHAVITR
jgi:hypothetical protein